MPVISIMQAIPFDKQWRKIKQKTFDKNKKKLYYLGCESKSLSSGNMLATSLR